METNYFVTITGIENFYGKKPYEINSLVKLTKEPSNNYDSEAIKVELPFIGTIGYVANTPSSVYLGTISAGRLYDKIGDYTYAQIMFITDSSVIAIVLSPSDIENNVNSIKIIKIDTNLP